MSKKIENSQQMEEEEDDAFDFALSWINKDSEAKKSVQVGLLLCIIVFFPPPPYIYLIHYAWLCWI